MKRLLKCVLASVALLVLAFSVTFSSTAVAQNATLKAPRMKGVHNVKDGLAVSWKSVDNAESYIVLRQREGKDGWRRVCVVAAPETACVDSSVKHSRTYKYVVKAVNGEQKSKASPNPKTNTFVVTPKLKSVSNVRTGVRLRWKANKNVTSVTVYRNTRGNENWKRLAALSGDSRSFIDTTAKSGVKYAYQVRQSIGNVMSVRHGSVKNHCFVATPKNLTAKDGYGSIVLGWNAVGGAKGYLIYRKVQGEEQWTQLAAVKTNAYKDSTAPTGKYVHYMVRAYVSSKSMSAYSYSAFSKLLDPKKAMVALTFDDGPYAPVTNQILDVLEKYKAKATFFVVGSRVSNNSECIKRASSLGCQIGNHTYNHKNLTEVSDSQLQSEIALTNSAIERLTGKPAYVVRAPGGAVNSRVRSLVGYPLVGWSVDTLDWKHRNTAKIIASVKSDVTDGSIVLMHDLYSTTANACDVVVPWLINQGYQLVTVSELMYYNGIKMTAGNLYTHA